MDRRLRVLLVDDDDDIRFLARNALEADGRYQIVGEGTNGHDATRISAALKPNIVLLDLEMPWRDGAEAVPIIRKRAPAAVIILWTVEPYGARADEAVALGAHAVLDKAYFGVGRLAEQIVSIFRDHHGAPRISIVGR